MQYVLFAMTPSVSFQILNLTRIQGYQNNACVYLCIFCYISYLKETLCFTTDYYQKTQDVAESHVLLKSQNQILYFTVHHKPDLSENDNRKELSIFSFHMPPPVSGERAI